MNDIYDYSFDQDGKYCYPGSTVLRNKLNIQDQSLLDDAEREITSIRIAQLHVQPMKGNYNFNHLKKIHRFIFREIYTWAGKARTVDISKGSLFCLSQYIESSAAKLFTSLAKENLLVGLSIADFIKRASFYFSEINALHPFREGNGRAQRVFIEQLALLCGYEIDFSTVDNHKMIEASANAMAGNLEKMEKLFREITRSITWQ